MLFNKNGVAKYSISKLQNTTYTTGPSVMVFIFYATLEGYTQFGIVSFLQPDKTYYLLFGFLNLIVFIKININTLKTASITKTSKL